MKKYNTILTLALITAVMWMLFESCSSNTSNTRAIIDKYCELNTKEHNAPTGAEKDAAAAAKKAYEKEVDDTYFKDNKTYQAILDGMKKCDEAFAGDTPGATALENNTDADLPSAYGDAASVANNYCTLIDKSIAAAQNSTDAVLKEIVAAKIIFEKNMEESYKNNPGRRDSLLQLIKPCMEKEIRFRNQK